MSYIFWILISFCHLMAEWDYQWFCSVHSLSCVRLFATPWTAAHQAFLSISNSQSLLKLMSIELVIPSNHLILCCPLLLLPSIFPNIRVFSNESVLHIRWSKYWRFSVSISPNIREGWTTFIEKVVMLSLAHLRLSGCFPYHLLRPCLECPRKKGGGAKTQVVQ